MPGDGDEDYDGVTGGWASATKGRLRWTKFKWILFFSNTLVSTHCFPVQPGFIVFVVDNILLGGFDILLAHVLQRLASCGRRKSR